MRLFDKKGELLTSIFLIIILAAFVRPTALLMPSSVETMLAVFLIVAFLLFSAVFWKEGPGDERENLHRLNAGRLSFIIGSGVLVVGIIFQSIGHEVDPWLVFALIAMIITKSISRIYSHYRN